VSAASIAKVLSGIKFPKNKDELIHYAEQHKDRIRKPVVVIETLKALDDTNFENMADVQKAVGNIR